MTDDQLELEREMREEQEKQERISRGNEASRLMMDPLINSTMRDLRAATLEELAKVDAKDHDRILRLQATIVAVDHLGNSLKAFIIDGNELIRDREETE